jgi:hypothetical protein
MEIEIGSAHMQASSKPFLILGATVVAVCSIVAVLYFVGLQVQLFHKRPSSLTDLLNLLRLRDCEGNLA